MKKLSRRQLMKISLGAAHLGAFGGLLTGGSRARAQAATGPTRLVTLYVPGGWMPTYFFSPLTSAEVPSFIPAPSEAENDPVFFVGSQLANLDGSGDASDGSFRRLRTPQLWNPSDPSTRASDRTQTNPVTGQHFNPNGTSWLTHRLWENAVVLHGIDQGTASHDSGRISAMCGAAGAEYRAPAIHAVVADALYDRFSDARPLPCVSLGSAPVPNKLDRRAISAPVLMNDAGVLQYTLSDHADSAWRGLREGRAPVTITDLDGNPLTDAVPLTPLERGVLDGMRRHKGRSTAGTDLLLQQLFDGYAGMSKLLARDVVSILEATPGLEHTGTDYSDVFTVARGTYLYDLEAQWVSSFDLTLRLLKADLTSSIAMEVPYAGHFDTHNANSYGSSFSRMLGLFEVIGRFLGELKQTPIGGGRTLLDDTVVMICSEFSRNWPTSGQDDHWPYTSVVLAGGGVTPNRMIGGYDTQAALGGTPVGSPADVIEETGQANTRVLRSADVVTTALHLLGIEDFFIPGGYGEIVGVRS